MTHMVAVVEAARAYCAVVSETTATPAEMVTGGRWVARLVEIRERRELAYVRMALALRAAGLAPADPVIDESDAAQRRRWAVYVAEEAARDALTEMRATAAGRWPPAYPARHATWPWGAA